MNQIGGGKCSLCGSDGTNMTTCPLNKNSTKPNQAKHYLCKQIPHHVVPVPIVRPPPVVPIVRLPDPVLINAIAPRVPLLPEIDLEIYNLTDFRNFSAPLGAGTYGQTVRAIRTRDGTNVVLKKYTSFNPIERIIPDDIIREIAILRKLNCNPSCNVVQLYGICVADDNSCIYLVLEPLSMDLYRKYINAPRQFPPIEYKKLLYKLLNAFSNIHGMGIVHNDIKPPNIMLTMDESDVRIIDFGLSEFLGLWPCNDFIREYISTETVKAPDMADDRGNITNNNRKSYNSDIFSIACTMFQIVMRNDWYRPHVRDGHINYTNLENNAVVNESQNNYFNIHMGAGTADILIRMLNSVSIERSTAKELLQEHYFDNVRHRPILNGGNIRVNVRRYAENEISNNSYEMAYIDEIHMNYVNDIITEIPSNAGETNIINESNLYVLDTRQLRIGTSNQPYDTLFHTINEFKYINRLDTVNNINMDTSLIQYLNLGLYSGLSEHFKADLFLNVYPVRDLWERTKRYLNLIKFVPITTHIAYIFIKLRKMFGIDGRNMPLYGNSLKSNDNLKDIEAMLILGLTAFYSIKIDRPSNFRIYDVILYNFYRSVNKLYGISVAEMINPINQICPEFVISNTLYNQINTLMTLKLTKMNTEERDFLPTFATII